MHAIIRPRAAVVPAATAAMLLALGLACSGAAKTASSGQANAASCRRYVAAFNDAPCTTIELDAEALCPETLDMSTCDLAPFWDCLASAVKCSGDFLDVGDQGHCKMPACN